MGGLLRLLFSPVWTVRLTSLDCLSPQGACKVGDFVILTYGGIKRLGRLFGKIKKYGAA